MSCINNHGNKKAGGVATLPAVFRSAMSVSEANHEPAVQPQQLRNQLGVEFPHAERAECTSLRK